MSTIPSTLSPNFRVSPNSRGMSCLGLPGAFLVGLLAISLISNVAAAPPQQKTSEKDTPAKRPVIVAVLNDGTTIEGVLDRFDKGVYSVRSAGKVYRFSEDDLKSISFQSRPLLRPDDHKNKSLEQLIERFIHPRQSQDAQTSVILTGDPAMVAPLAARGSRAIKPLIAEVKKKSLLYGNVGKIFHLMSPDVLPQLVEIFRQEPKSAFGSSLFRALQLRGVASIPLLKEMIVDPDMRIRRMGVDALYSIGSRSGTTLPESLTPLLIKLLDDPSREIIVKTLRTLGDIGKPVDQIVPATIKTMKKDEYGNIASAAVRELSFLGRQLSADDKHRKQILSVLLDALDNHASISVRGTVAFNLGNWGTHDHVAIDALRRATKSPDGKVRSYARKSLYKLGSAPSDAVTPEGIKKQSSLNLVKILAGEDTTAIYAAREELARRKPDEKLFTAMQEVVRIDEKNHCWGRVAELIGGWDRETVLPALETFARDEHHRVRKTAACAYGRMKLPTLPASVLQLCRDSDGLVRLTMINSLCDLSADGQRELHKQIVPLLIAALNDELLDADGRQRAASALQEIGPTHPGVVTALIDLLHYAKSPDLRQVAVDELGLLGSRLRRDHKDLDRIVAAMAEALSKEGQSDVRYGIIDGFHEMGFRARAALPGLRKAADDPIESISEVATEAIREIQKKPPMKRGPNYDPFR